MENIEVEKAVLAGLSADSMDIKDRSTEESMDELEALLETAGGVSVGRVLQNRAAPTPGLLLERGRSGR